MRILFLSDNFPPESNAPATRLHEHAVRWVRAGHDVTVITCAPNFPEGKLFPGYRNRWRQVETIDGIRVVRMKTLITANEGTVLRTLDYMSFMLMGLVGGLLERRPDMVIATSPQFFCAIGGWMLSALRRLPFVFELRDLWPASIIAVGAMRKGLVIRSLEAVEMFLYRRADAIIPVTHAFKDDLVRRGIDPSRIHVIINGVDLDRYAPAPPDLQLAREFGTEGKFVVGYLGTHGLAHALIKVVDAAELLRNRDDIVFLFAGGGAERDSVEREVRSRGLQNVRLVPRQPKEMMPRLWSLCTVALIPLRNTPVFATVLPSKLFESMGMGVPVLMSLPAGEATRIVEETGCGVCVAPEQPQALAKAIDQLARDPEQLARLRHASASAAPDFSRARQAQRMLACLAKVLDAH